MGAFQQLALSVLLLGVAGRALSATCPPEEDIDPCWCSNEDEDTDLALVCETVTLEELKKALNSVGKDVTLSIDLEESEIGILPSDFFQGLKVVRLTISHCELDSLAEEGGRALSGLEDTLQELNIYSSFLEENGPARLDVSHLRKLHHLDISSNIITELGDDWFAHGPASLRELILSNNGIEKLGSNAFANLVNIEELWLDGNRFGPFSRSMLPNPANQLDDLQLDNNAFTSIPEDLFSGMPALRTVTLRTNGISRLPQTTWQGVWEQLESIDLRGNPLDCDSHIDWILSSNTLAMVSGQCATPRERAGVDLNDLVGKV